MADCRQGKALTPARAAQKGIGQLDEDSRTVALQRVGPRGPAVREVLEDLQPLGDDVVAFRALDMHDEPQPARIVLVGRIVETLAQRGEVLGALSMIHVGLVCPAICLGRRRRREGRRRGRRPNIFILTRLLHRGN